MLNINEAKAYLNELCNMYGNHVELSDDAILFLLSDDFYDSFLENISCGRSFDASIQWDM